MWFKKSPITPRYLWELLVCTPEGQSTMLAPQTKSNKKLYTKLMLLGMVRHTMGKTDQGFIRTAIGDKDVLLIQKTVRNEQF